MACSEAQRVANRRNALRSTGPRTVAGKATSRLNAWRHGMAGAGDVLAPGEEAGAVEARTRAFVAQLAAPGEVGVELAHRAAVLSDRLRALNERNRALARAAARAAREQFDADRLDEIGTWAAGLPDPQVDLAALDGLEASPEGLDELIPAWERLRARVRAAEPAALDQAARWLVLRADERGDLPARIDAELARLGRLAADPGPLLARQTEARHEAGLIASFAPTPEALLALRYEAATERGLFRALSEIRALNRQADPGPAPPRRADDVAALLAALEAALPAPPSLASQPDPAAPAPAPPAVLPPTIPAAAPAAMASFRARDLPLNAPISEAHEAWREPAFLPHPTRPPRPDLRKMAKKRR